MTWPETVGGPPPHDIDPEWTRDFDRTTEGGIRGVEPTTDGRRDSLESVDAAARALRERLDARIEAVSAIPFVDVDEDEAETDDRGWDASANRFVAEDADLEGAGQPDVAAQMDVAADTATEIGRAHV